MSEQGKAVETEVLLLETTVAPAEEAALLGIPTGSKVVQLDRLRRVDGEPICLARTLLPLPRFAGLAGQDLSRSSLYEVLHDAFDVEPGHRLAHRRGDGCGSAHRRAARRTGRRAVAAADLAQRRHRRAAVRALHRVVPRRPDQLPDRRGHHAPPVRGAET